MNGSGKRSDVDYDLVAYYYDLFFGDDEEANYDFGNDEEANYDQLKLQEEENFVSGRLEADVNTYYETIECTVCNEPSDPNDGSTRKRQCVDCGRFSSVSRCGRCTRIRRLKQSSNEWRNKMLDEVVDDAESKRQKKECAVSVNENSVADRTALTCTETLSDANSGVSVDELVLDCDEDFPTAEMGVTVEFNCLEDCASLSENSDESGMTIQTGSFDSIKAAIGEQDNDTQRCRGTIAAADCCCNCHRVDIGTIRDVGHLRVKLSRVPIECITRYERRWITFDRNLAGATVSLCSQCQQLLTKENRDHRKNNKCAKSVWSYIWPVYMWKLITCEEMLDKYGPNVLHWIPKSCHRYWKQSLIAGFPAFYHSSVFIEHEQSVPVVVDGTMQKLAFKGVLERNLLGEIKKACDEYLIPNVLCPWGCSAYMHNGGFVSFDAIINKYFPFVGFTGTIASKSEKARVASSRNDFLSTQIDVHLFNDKWSVHPTVDFIPEIGPVILTCDSHDRGTTKLYFHLPKAGTCLPAATADVLSHAVLNARVLHRTKAHHYSTTFQLNKCSGSYSGVECSHVSDNRHFDFVSHITDIHEARSYAGRIDIKGLVGRLNEQNIISDALASSYAERAASLFGDTDLLDSLSSGATMITLKDAMRLQEMLTTHPISTIVIDVDNAGVALPESMCSERTIRRQWPCSLISIHPNDGYGAPIQVLPAMQSKGDSDNRLLWSLCHCLLGVSSLWERASASLKRTSDWNGFVLSYLSKRILGQSVTDKQFRGDPFDVPLRDSRSKPCGLSTLLSKHCCRYAPPNYSFCGNEFRPSDFALLFCEDLFGSYVHTSQICTQSTGFSLWDSINRELPAECETIILFRGEQTMSGLIDCVPFTFTTAVGHGCSEFELRLVIASKVVNGVNKTGRNSWTSEVWMRHGCNVFSNWWYTTRSPTFSAVKKRDLSDVIWDNVDLLVYSRMENISLSKYRSDYLRYIGGQGKIFCGKHNIPLIVATSSFVGDANNVCTHKPNCGGKVELKCPVDCCLSCICKGCFKGLPNSSNLHIVSDAEYDLKQLVSGDSDSSVDSKASLFSHSGELLTGGFDAESDCNSETGETASLDYNPFDCLPTGNNFPGFGTGEFAPEGDENEYDKQHEHLFPTTMHAEDDNIIEGGMGVIGTSVLLNKCGTLLVRRDTQLQASRRERHIIERIASRRDVGTVPLVYLEGILFPSIFWCLSNNQDGGILGSMPTSLFCQHSTRKRLGIASLSDHAKTRLKSVGNTASTDPRYLTFMFDGIANGALEGNDTRVVLSRGFEESMGPAGMRVRNKDDCLYSDTIDNRQCVHDLCASEKDDAHDLFITLTCNQREHFGLRHIKRYIDDGEALHNYKLHFKQLFPMETGLSFDSEREVQKALQQASMTLTVRNWMEIRKILIQYILLSPELPLGSKVNKIFVRDEYQGDAGNLSHLHMIVALSDKYSSSKGKASVETVIRGFVDEIVAADEVESYISEGLIEDYQDYEYMKLQARSYLAHHCSDRCMRRTGPGVNDVVCRVPDARLVSEDITRFTVQHIEVDHSPQATAVMSRIGLCAHSVCGTFIPNRDYLVSKRIHAPVRHGEGNISPVVGRLFAATRSAMNVQICTSSGTSRYVVKYLIKMDENNYIAFRAKQKQDNASIKAEKVFMCNTKVTSSAINEEKKLSMSRHKALQKGRSIACTEMIQLILGFPQIHSNINFLRVPTLPLGERPGLERMSPDEYFNSKCSGSNKDAFSVMVPTVAAREQAFKGKNSYRRHTVSQVAMLRDQMLSRVTLDRVFIFSVRPPELLFVDKLDWYYRIFERSAGRAIGQDNPASKVLAGHLNNSTFLDGLGHEILIRPSGIPLLKSIIFSNNTGGMGDYGFSKMKSLMLKIVEYYEKVGVTAQSNFEAPLSRGALIEWRTMQSTFLDIDSLDRPLPVVVFSNVKPLNASKFLIHILLSMGHFQTERDLWVNASIPKAFIAARLVPRHITESDVDCLLRAWVDEQLRYYPIGSKKMDDYIVSGERILYAALLRNEIPVDDIPPVMYTSLVQSTNESIEKHIAQCKITLTDATLKALSKSYNHDSTSVLPSREALLSSTKQSPVRWNPILPKTQDQSIKSYGEQLQAQGVVMDHIDSYCRPNAVMAKNILIAGPPGVGKTHCMSHGIVYALAKGLTVMTTALLADRAFMLGGRHLHKLFKLRSRDRGSPNRLAELAVIALQKKPCLFEFIRRLDVLFIDECGQISAELLSVIDIIARKVRDSSSFLGGVLIVGTIDQVQLQPINGLPFLLSPYILTMFSIVALKEYVRCAKCTILQEMNELARSFPTTEEELARVRRRLRYLIGNYCTFVDSWESPLITDDVMRIFPRKDDTAKSIQSFLRTKKQFAASTGAPFLFVDAEDSMVAMESHADWKSASRPVVTYINSKLREPERLCFFRGAVYQFTHNSPGKYNATQLGVLTEVPTQEQINSFEDIPILVAPPGTKSIDTNNLPNENTPGWLKTKVGAAPQNPINMWNHGVKARRKQYALRHHVASTIHSAIGHTVSKVATELGNGKEIWEKAMVVVLISRVSEAKDLLFVGNRQENINALIRGLCIRSQYDEYMNHIVEVLSSTSSGTNTISRPLLLSKHPYRQRDVALPDDTSGLVYMLVSINCPGSIYIGMTNDIVRRLKQHNSGLGARSSSDPSKRPWGLLAYVSGFQYNRSMMRQFELRWQNIVAHIKPQEPRSAALLATQIIERYYDQFELRLVMTMDFPGDFPE